MADPIAKFFCVVLYLLAAFFSQSQAACHVRLTPPADVLFSIDVPVYSIRADASSPVGHTLTKNDTAMPEVRKNFPQFPESTNGIGDNAKECDISRDGWSSKLDFKLEHVAPEIIYPKIVLVVDSALHELWGSLTDVLLFLVAFWNSVDLHFRSLEHPRLRIHIAGIVVAENSEALAFLRKDDSPEMDMDFAIESFTQFMETSGTSWSSLFGDYDMAIGMIGAEFCSMEDGECTHEPYKLASDRARDMCQDVKTKGPPGKGLLSMDSKDWMRTRRAAKLIEDLLVPWGFKGEKFNCEKYDNAVAFSYSGKYLTNMPDWSDCYLKSFKKRLNRKLASCMFSKPNITAPLPRLLLGRIFTGDHQCNQYHFPYSAGENDPNICVEHRCTFVKGVKIRGRMSIPAADGTTCAADGICFRRRCVKTQKLH